MPGGGELSVSLDDVELSEDGGVPLPAGRYVRIAVADGGVGISPEHLHRKFRPVEGGGEDGGRGFSRAAVGGGDGTRDRGTAVPQTRQLRRRSAPRCPT